MNCFTYGKDGLALTENFESVRLAAYQDLKGIWTIGYGHTLNVHPTLQINQAQAELYLREDVKAASDAVSHGDPMPLIAITVVGCKGCMNFFTRHPAQAFGGRYGKKTRVRGLDKHASDSEASYESLNEHPS